MGYQSQIEKADRTSEAMEFPEVVLLDNFNACNLKCSMCDHGRLREFRRFQRLDIGLYTKIIDEIAVEKPDARVWQIFFGEPFLCPDMAERVRYAKSKGLTDVVLNSNGVLMSEEKAKEIIEAGLDALYVGIDAATSPTYLKIRIGGDFERTVGNVLKYRDLLKNIGRPEQKLFVQYVVSGFNEHEVEAFKRFWVSEGVTVKIRPKVSWAGLVEASNLRDNKEVERRPCYWIMRTMNILADGDVALCSVDVHGRVRSGNIREHTLKEIWNGPLKRLRELHKEGRYEELPEMCRNCSDWQSAYADYVKPGE